MLNVEEALQIILSNTTVIDKSESVDVFNSYGRILYNDIIADFNIPYKDNSSMDGYAVHSDDIITADFDHPVTLKIAGETQAGHEFQGNPLHRGEAIRIMTGAHVPDGADCVVQFEDTEESGNSVRIFKRVLKNENIRFAGEDIKQGTIVLKRGTRLDSADTGILSSLNFKEIPVFIKPKVAIISTGDELTEPGDIKSGKIVNSNAYLLFSEVKKYGGDPVYGGIAKDNYDDVKNSFLKMINNDIIISSGGVSMGRYDYVPDVLRELGIEIKLHKVSIKPGKPIIFGTSSDKVFFGLPGNPVSATVTFMQFVRPALLKMSGNIKINKPVLKAEITENISKEKGRRHYIRGIFHIDKGRVLVKTTGLQSSGMLTSMNLANCLIIIPEETESVKSGEMVDIQLIGHNEI